MNSYPKTLWFCVSELGCYQSVQGYETEEECQENCKDGYDPTPIYIP
jgi:hypothetical protein